ncbi:MAG: protelomerase family protein [Waterburya sp.]
MAIARIAEFISKLEQANSHEYQQLCAIELDYLRSSLGIKPVFNSDGYPISVTGGSVSGLKKQVSLYRNAIREVELTAANSDSMVKNGQRIRIHKALKFFNLQDYEKDEVKQQRLARDRRDKSDRPSFDAIAVIAKAESLLTAKSYVSKLAGLYVLTGRRHGELMQTAQFSNTGLSCNLLQQRHEDTSYHVLFSGQQKTSKKGLVKKVDVYGMSKHSDVPYKIPLLCEKEKAQTAISWLREHHPCPIGTRAKGSKELGQKTKKEFSRLLPDVTPHKLRSAYCAMVWSIYRHSGNKNPTEDLVIDLITGHNSDTTESAQAYMDYELDQTTATSLRQWFNHKRLTQVAPEWL